MDASFKPIEIVPSSTAFGLDQLRRSYKTALSATAAIAAAPAVGTADETFPNMFLVPISTPESAESATRVDLVYMGTFGSTLPAQKHDSGDAVQSASSSWGSGGATIGTVSVQFYAPQNTLTYFSYLGVGTDEAADPTGDPQIITVTAGSGTFAPGTTIATLATSYFSSQIVHSLDSSEIVPGKYWQNVSRKTKVLVPFIITIPAGTALIGIGAPGTGYNVGDTLSISAGGESATIVVASLGVSQSILQISVTSNTFTTAQSLLVPSGGGGSGALFNVIIV